jgi:TonB-dependent receptor
MRVHYTTLRASLAVSASMLALLTVPSIAAAQANPSEGAAPESAADGDEIIVTGIRASLKASLNIKRDAQGVVDAISAEDIGKFPDTNLAESLQRITGVSIDRSVGEGSYVTVRGFGPEFNLVTLNGRQMPTSTLGDGGSAPSTRSFDFANLASEGIAGVEVYKTGRAAIASGGIGATINIKTTRPLDSPGLKGSFGVKGVWDTSRNKGNPITPEVSGIISDTFADNKIGVAISASYQKRKASVNQANVGWRDGYLGSENNWGSLAPLGSPGAANITNRPGPNDVYAVPQNASYDLTDINRERINGQAVLQFRPTDSVTATVDYTYSQNLVEARTSSVGIWFNHGDTSSAWTNGPVAGPLFYSEKFGPGKDLAYSSQLTANKSINKSLGFNLKWDAPDGMTFALDYHNSTAESKPTNKYGSSTNITSAVFGVAQQGINFTKYLPVISYTLQPGLSNTDPSLITPTGNAFRNAYVKDKIQQVQLMGKYEFESGFLDSIDFGASYVENKVRSAFGVIQNDTWGGAGPASDIPDDIFKLQTIPDKFKGISGSNDPNIIKQFYTFNFERMFDLIDNKYKVCGGDGVCAAPFTTDRRIKELTLSPYLQVNSSFDVAGRPAHIIAGVRYDVTDIDSQALVPVPVGTKWVSANEFNLIYAASSDFTRVKGSYQNWLPSFDADFEPVENVKLRGSYSKTITRASYDNLQGGQEVGQLFRIGGGNGSQGNPNLLPYKSENFDASAEWYYGDSSYVSVGYFRKKVKNFISQDRVDLPLFNLPNPASGPRYAAAVAALGSSADANAIRNYIFTNFPSTTRITGKDALNNITGDIFGVAGDNPLNFEVALPVNNNETANLNGWEFAVQHNFWDTGFGAILNYTIVNGDVRYDNTKPHTVTQFALTGLSDSANAVLFYDKHGLQYRIAYNWRDEFLGGTGPNPYYTQAYGQFDVSASFDITDKLTVFAEGINITNESRRGHRRANNEVFFASPGYARYNAGVRFTF